MTYREIGISIRSAYTQGWPDDASRLAFRTETRKLFRDAGWQVEEKPLDRYSAERKRRALSASGSVQRRDAGGSYSSVAAVFVQRGYVGERIEQLIADGRLITAQTRYGQGLRTATEAELGMAENADPMQMHF